MSKIALVLEGGGLRGVFTAGVIDCFIDNDVNLQADFDLVPVSSICSTRHEINAACRTTFQSDIALSCSNTVWLYICPPAVLRSATAPSQFPQFF